MSAPLPSAPPAARTALGRWCATMVVLALSVAACGGDAPAAPSPPPTGVLQVTGQDDLRFDREELTAPAGTVTVELRCEGAANHNLVIEERDQEVVACAPGQTATGSIDLEPGVYTYLCTVPGHEATMRGQLTVQ